MTNDLKEKAIDIKGKNYVLVSDRVIYFNETYLKGSIKTQLVSQPEAQMVVIKAIVIPDITIPERYFTGYSQATWGDGNVNKTSALENCETSAVGRALAMMGIGVIDSIASVDEMKKAGVSNAIYQSDEERMEFKDSNCTKCGAPIKISQAGKPYCSALCWKNPPQEKVVTYDEIPIPEDLPF